MLTTEQWGVVVAALPVAYSIWKYGIKPIVRWVAKIYEAIESIDRIAVSIENLDNQHKEILKDLKPNGGTSLRDAINQIEELAVTTNQAQKAILELLQVGFFLTDAKGAFVYVNRYWQTLSGLPKEEAVGSGWANGVHPEDRKYVIREWELATTEERPFNCRYRMLNRMTGEIHYVEGVSTPLRGVSGKVYGHAGVVTVVDELES